jgi:hypothetical protein
MAHAVLGLEMADDGLDGGSAFELTLDGGRHAAFLAGDDRDGSGIDPGPPSPAVPVAAWNHPPSRLSAQRNHKSFFARNPPPEPYFPAISTTSTVPKIQSQISGLAILHGRLNRLN